MGAFTVNIIDQVIMRGHAFRNLGVSDAFFPIRFQGKLCLYLCIDVLDTDNNVLFIPG